MVCRSMVLSCGREGECERSAGDLERDGDRERDRGCSGGEAERDILTASAGESEDEEVEGDSRCDGDV